MTPLTHTSSTAPMPNDFGWLATLDSALQRKVERRVVGQLLQTLLYESVLPYRLEDLGAGRQQFTVAAQDASGQALEYRCQGLLSDSFALIRLQPETLVRVDAQGQAGEASLHQALAELLGGFSEQPHFARFVEELEQTQLKDLQSRRQGYQAPRPAHELDADSLERHFMDAHSYHPCYKSRIGFSLADNARFGPEFGGPIRPVWLAVARHCGVVNHSQQLNIDAFIQREFGRQRWQRWQADLNAQGRDASDYLLLPVHPWQWQQRIVNCFYPELLRGDLLYLGESDDAYHAQQSIRTLANGSEPKRPYVKLAMNLTNTSSTRSLAQHTVLNGPLITDWLQHLISSDSTAQALDFVILGEVAGVSFDYRELPATRSAQTYGSLGAIWRESLHQYLRADEQAVPFNGLSHVENRYASGEQAPFIATWIERHGLHAWTRQLLQVTALPVLHMLFAEGIGMESHGQNIVLIHRDGWPLRIALKDFHDGVRYSPAHLRRPLLAPELVPLPASHSPLMKLLIFATELAIVLPRIESQGAHAVAAMTAQELLLRVRLGDGAVDRHRQRQNHAEIFKRGVGDQHRLGRRALR